MEISNAPKLTLDDIVFQGRNRTYGAYLLRKLYSQHINLATAISIASFVLLLLLPGLARLWKDEPAVTVPENQRKVIVELQDITTPVLPPPVKPIEPPAEPVQPVVEKVKTIKNTPPEVVPDHAANPADDVPTTDQLKTTTAGTTTQDGADKVLIGAPDEKTNTSGGTGFGTEPLNIVHTHAEVMPAFPGGAEAMYKFIQENMSYPSGAKRVGISGTVFVSFTIAASGSIYDIKVVKGLGGGTDEEAVRVIKSMPNWSPGKMNERAVPVRLTLPIRFVLK